MEGAFGEKQILDRRKAFQAGFIAALLTICAMRFATGVLGLRMTADARFLITIQLPLNICLVALIGKDAYECANASAEKTAMSVSGAASLFVLISTMVLLMQRREQIFNNGWAISARAAAWF